MADDDRLSGRRSYERDAVEFTIDDKTINRNQKSKRNKKDEETKIENGGGEKRRRSKWGRAAVGLVGCGCGAAGKTRQEPSQARGGKALTLVGTLLVRWKLPRKTPLVLFGEGAVGRCKCLPKRKKGLEVALECCTII